MAEDVRFNFVEEASPQHHDQRAEEQDSGAHGASSITSQRCRPLASLPEALLGPRLSPVTPAAGTSPRQPPEGSQGWF